MKHENRLTRFLRTMSITSRFSLGIGLLVGLIATVALTGYLLIFYVHHAENAIQTSTEIQRMVLTMDQGMERARHLHADFFLQYPVIGLATAHEQYAQPAVRQVARVIKISRNLKNLIENSTVSNAFQKSQVDLNLYLSSAKRFADTSIQSVELVTALAAPVNGLEAQMDYHLEAMRAALKSDRLINLYARMRSYVQEYRISRKRFLMQSAFNKGFLLRGNVSRERSIDADSKQLIYDLLDRFRSTAEKTLAVDVAIKSKFKDFALQGKAVQPISNTLIELANKEVRQARARINHANRAAFGIMAAITLTGLILAAYIARLLNNSITSRVVKLTATAGELRAGNLEALADERGHDELSELAHTLNVMSARMRELICNLENKVDQRTAELAASEGRFRDLFEHSSSGVAVFLMVDDAGDFILLDINKALERIEQVKRREVVGRRLTEVFPGVAAFGLLDVLRQVARTGRSARHPVSYYADGRLAGWREISVYKLPSGEIVAIYDDLTAQKQAEIEKKDMEARLQQAQKMEAIGVLAGGIAHDFNNILGIILGNTELAADDTPQWSPAAQNLDEIRTACVRAKDVIRQLLSFSRKTERTMQPVSIILLIKESLSLIRASIPANIAIEQQVSEDCGTVVADPTQMHQVIINLCTNAAHAMEKDGGVIRVTASRTMVTGDNPVEYPEIQPGVYLQLTVSDTGSGMSPEIRNRIFDPYFTTKEVGKGSGMGLAVVHGIVKNHGGAIAVESNPGRGTIFKILLPEMESEAGGLADTPPASPPEALPIGSERILLVDDEAGLVNSMRNNLERLGYQIVSTCDPGEAFDLFKSRPDDFDLVITDMDMPKMTGDRLAQKILQLQPAIPIILCSGYHEGIGPEKAKALGISKFVQKPFDKNELAQAVREALTG